MMAWQRVLFPIPNPLIMKRQSPTIIVASLSMPSSDGSNFLFLPDPSCRFLKSIVDSIAVKKFQYRQITTSPAVPNPTHRWKIPIQKLAEWTGEQYIVLKISRD
jgi:hypothetical protein